MVYSKKERRLFVSVVVALLVLAAITAAGRIWKKSQIGRGDSSGAGQLSKIGKVDGLPGVVIDTDEGVKKVNITTGEKIPVTSLEQEDFSGFSGLPTLGDNNGKNLEQSGVLVAGNKSQAILTIVAYDSSQSSDEWPILGSDDYLCDITKKECQKTDLLDQDYQGLDGALQKKSAAFAWSAWDNSKNLLFGRLFQKDTGDISPVYVCDTQKKACAKTEGYDWQKQGDQKAVVPAGAVSPLADKFVMINQHDDPNKTTGKNWELLLYSSSDLSRPQRTYDISASINHDEVVAYDSVHSVTWSNDEKLLAFATGNRIYSLDLEAGKLTLLYMTAVDEDGNSDLDPDALEYSPDGRFVFFVESSPVQPSDISASNDDENQTEQSTLNVLKKINLENGNMASEVLEEKGLSLKQ